MFQLAVFAVACASLAETVTVLPLNQRISPSEVKAVFVVIFTAFYQFIVLFLSLRPEPMERRIISPMIHKIFYKSYHFLLLSRHKNTALGESG